MDIATYRLVFLVFLLLCGAGSFFGLAKVVPFLDLVLGKSFPVFVEGRRCNCVVGLKVCDITQVSRERSQAMQENEGGVVLSGDALGNFLKT